MSEQLKEAEPRAPWHRAGEGEGGSSSILGRARHISCDFQEHRARSHQPRISPESCSWIFKPQTRPNSSPIKVNKSLPLIRAVAGPGPHWCLLEARYKVWLLFYCYTSDPHSLHYFQACKQAGNSAHTVTQTAFASLIGTVRAREGFECGLHRAAVHRICRMQQSNQAA